MAFPWRHSAGMGRYGLINVQGLEIARLKKNSAIDLSTAYKLSAGLIERLATLMPLALRDLDQPTIEAWAAKEGLIRPSSARLAWRLLTVFLTWCAEQPAYAALLNSTLPSGFFLHT